MSTLADWKSKLLVLLDGKNVKSKDGKNVKVISKEDVKKARENFRDSCTKLRLKADKLSEKADKMNQKLKKGKQDNLSNEIPLAKSCMDMRRHASEINKQYKLEIKALV